VGRRDKRSWLLAQPGWLESVLDAFDWASWATRSRPPIDMEDLKAGQQKVRPTTDVVVRPTLEGRAAVGQDQPRLSAWWYSASRASACRSA
jgi:hypothetical protein